MTTTSATPPSCPSPTVPSSPPIPLQHAHLLDGQQSSTTSVAPTSFVRSTIRLTPSMTTATQSVCSVPNSLCTKSFGWRAILPSSKISDCWWVGRGLWKIILMTFCLDTWLKKIFFQVALCSGTCSSGHNNNRCSTVPIPQGSAFIVPLVLASIG